MSIITLTTDWSQNDYYLGALKGKIYSLCSGAVVVDITHQIPSFDLSQAAFILKNSFPFFPKKTVHLIGVNSEAAESRNYLALYAQGHYFVGADNGIFSLLLDGEDPEMAINIKLDEREKNSTFPCVSILARAACYLAEGGKIENLGEAAREIYRQVPIMATIDDSVISGSVIYIDSFQNAITNINLDLFNRIAKGRAFEIIVQSNHYKINKINKHYYETAVGEMLAIFNSAHLLEIAINNGNAAELLNLDTNSTVRVRFFDEQEIKKL
ncbi:MAG: SAM-dependent chlorinase/fluorinase [Bacteroidota bacterium]|nr:SAM-dependent chlorinase/fluorinase [Bacteroidota bacterium]